MSDSKLNELLQKKIKLDGLRMLIHEELETFKRVCEENKDPEEIARSYQIFEKNIRLLKETAQII